MVNNDKTFLSPFQLADIFIVAVSSISSKLFSASEKNGVSSLLLGFSLAKAQKMKKTFESFVAFLCFFCY
jgi:hypothetical protein